MYARNSPSRRAVCDTSSNNNCRKQIFLKNIVAAKNKNLKGKEFSEFNEPYKGKKGVRKESDNAFDIEQENTKGSSFN